MSTGEPIRSIRPNPNHRKSLTQHGRDGVNELQERFGIVFPLLTLSALVMTVTWLVVPATGLVALASLASLSVLGDEIFRRARSQDRLITEVYWGSPRTYIAWKMFGDASALLVVGLLLGFKWEFWTALVMLAIVVRRFWWPTVNGWFRKRGPSKRPSGPAPRNVSDPGNRREPDGS